MSELLDKAVENNRSIEDRLSKAAQLIPDPNPTEYFISEEEQRADQERQQQQEEQQEQPAEQEQQPQESKSEYYARLTKMDNENRELKRKLKQLQSQEDPRQKIRENPIEALKEMGIGEDQLYEAWLNHGNQEGNEEAPTNNSALSKKEEEYIKRLESLENALKEKEYNEQLQSSYKTIEDTLNKDKERWELIGNEHFNDIIQAFEQEYQQGDDVMEVLESVLDNAEEVLLDLAKKDIERYMNKTKTKGLFTVTPEKSETIEEKPATLLPTKAPSKTLSSSTGGGTTIPQPARSAQERMNRAMMKLLEAEKPKEG